MAKTNPIAVLDRIVNSIIAAATSPLFPAHDTIKSLLWQFKYDVMVRDRVQIRNREGKFNVIEVNPEGIAHIIGGSEERIHISELITIYRG